jgi:pilus assembly protein CpaF
MLARIETMILLGADIPLRAVRQQIASSIDIIVHLGRLRDRSRRVLEITEVLAASEDGYIMNPIFRFCEADDVLTEVTVYNDELIGSVNGQLKRTGSHLKHRRKLRSSALESPEI